MLKIAITGGIAAGKSSVAREFERLGAFRMDADEIARVVVEPGRPALAKLVEAFGKEILHEDGTLNRALLGSLVFGNQERVALLNAIVHPEIFAETQSMILDAEEAGESILVYEIPLFIESKNSYHFDYVVTVESGEKEQHRRLVELRGMTPKEAQNRIDIQATSEQRKARADLIIDSSVSIEHTVEQVRNFWEESLLPQISKQ